MSRWKALASCAVSLSLATSWTLVAAAQADGAPDPAPPDPAAPGSPATPAEPAPPLTPPAPTPPSEMQPPAPPTPPPPVTPAPSTAPPAGAFPLPATPPPTANQRPDTTAPPPPPSTSTPARESPARKPSDGLFEARPGAENHPHVDDDKDEGTDQFKIGPVVGIGIPSIVSFGGTLKLTRFLGAGVDIGLIPKVQLSYYGDATLSYQHYDIYGRLYPFGGGFFLSGGAGYATVDGTLSSSKTVAASGFSGTVDYDSKGSVRTLMLTALIGYFYTTGIGFSFGIDAGAQIPIAPSQVSYASAYHVTTAVPGPLGMAAQAEAERQAAPIVTATDKSVRDTLEKIGRTTLPTINLRIGWIL